MYRVYRDMHGNTDCIDLNTISEVFNFLESSKAEADWEKGAKFEVWEISDEESKL